MKDNLIIVSDIAGTIEVDNTDEMNNFENALNDLEQISNCNVQVCFITGYSRESMKEMEEFISEKHPILYQKYACAVADYSFIEKGKSRVGRPNGSIIEKDIALADDILPYFDINEVAGLVYIGDSNVDDAPAFKMAKSLGKQFKLGSYTIMPYSKFNDRSNCQNQSYKTTTPFVDFSTYSTGLKATNEGLRWVSSQIEKQMGKEI